MRMEKLALNINTIVENIELNMHIAEIISKKASFYSSIFKYKGWEAMRSTLHAYKLVVN